MNAGKKSGVSRWMRKIKTVGVKSVFVLARKGREKITFLRLKTSVPACFVCGGENMRAMHLSYCRYALLFIVAGVCLFVLSVPFFIAKG